MSDVQVTPPAKGGGGVNPSFTATAFFPSGLNASGLVQVPSGFFASGLEASALIKGTIGQFLATALAGSGVNASGQVGGASGIFKSGISAPDLEVSTINGAPPGTTTSTFTSGLTTCALASIGASLIVDGSAVVESALNLSGQLTAASALVACGLNLSAQAQLASAVVESGLNLSAQLQAASIVAESGVNLSGAIQGTTASFTGISGSTYTGASGVFASGENVSAVIQGASALLESGLNLSGTEAATSILIACTLATSGLASFGGSAAFASGLNTSGLAAIGGNVSAANVAASQVSGASGLLASGANLSGVLQGASALLESGLNLSGTETAASVLVACTLAVSGAASVGGTATLNSALVPCTLAVSGAASVGGTATLNSALVPCTLTVSGLASIGGTANFDASANFTSAVSALNINVSTINGAPPGTTTSTFSSGLTTCALTSIGASLIVDGYASFTASVIFGSAVSALDIEVSTINGAPPGTTTSTFSSGLTTCALASIGASLIVDGTASFGTSVAFGSGFNTSAKVVLGAQMSVAGSGAFGAQVLFSAAAVFEAPSTGQPILILVATGQIPNLIQVSQANAGQIFTLGPSGTLSTVGSVLIGCTLAVSGTASIGGLTKVQGGLQHGVASINASLTLSAGNGIVLADASTAGSAVTVLLPSAATVSGQIFYVIKRDSSANSVIVAAQTTDSIEGVSQVNAGTQYGKFHLTNAGSVTWYNFGSGLI